MKTKPAIPKGTRDFSPVEMARRNYIFDIIKKEFHQYGFEQIETPAMENLQTLTGKYGDEGDKLIFKILNSGDYLKKADKQKLEVQDSNGLISSISEKALRYDLTVPFARYVVQHQNDIVFPFKRFQIQPVWRADRPQKGRYREFYQCDADIIGSNSLLNEADLIQIIDGVFTALFQQKLSYTIAINNRKILSGIAEIIGAPEKIIDITVAIDKLDKIGEEKVLDELRTKDISEDAIEKIVPLFSLSGTAQEKLTFLSEYLQDSAVGLKGIEELQTVLSLTKSLGLKSANLELDVTLARGLNYYTGAIFEVKIENFPSITGGGRYDDLTGVFGLKDVSGVGISFGADRIYDVLLDNNLYPEFIDKSTEVMFINFGETEVNYCLLYAAELRKAGMNVEIYPDSVKMKKQMKYANDKNIKIVVLAGDQEITANSFVVKFMESGEQQTVNKDQLVSILQA